MATKCENCPIRRRDLFVEMTADELKFMEKFKVGEMVVDSGTPILMEGSNSPQLYTVLHGMGLRFKLLENGRRQVINFVFPGDFLGMQAGIMGEMGHSVEATTQMTLCVFDRSAIWSLFRDHPERGFDLSWIAAVEEHFMGEAISALGQRNAYQSVAWALSRMFLRGKGLRLVENATMRLPYKQQDLADALGLSLVHTNKTLAKLRDRQVASWSDGYLQVNDIERLAEVGLASADPIRARPIM